MNTKTTIEFFAGIGLIHEAIKCFGWNVVFANDNCPKKVAAYRANFPGTPLSNADVRELSSDAIPYARLATASFPCIDLSQAGYREGINGEKSGVVWSFLNHIDCLRQRGKAPEFLLLENVPGLLSLHDGASIDVLLQRIADMGYSFDLVQVDACHFLPQTRNRVFIIAVLGQNRLPSGSFPDNHIRRYKVREVYERNPHLPWMFFSFPALPAVTVKLRDIIEPLADADARWWDQERMAYFWKHLEVHHKPALMSLCQNEGRRWLTATRRLRRRGIREQIINVRFDGVASCLRTPGGGSSTQMIVEVGGGKARVRNILGSELARLQGVCLPNASPDFILPPTETECKQGFGDAVCVPVVKWVLAHSIERLVSQDPLLPSSNQMAFDLVCA